MGNREREMIRQQRYYGKWKLSSKYTDYLMRNLTERNNYSLYEISHGIYKQFLSELRSLRYKFSKRDVLIQCWDTMIQTTRKNPKIDIQSQSIRLLHQTSVQRSYQHV